MKLSKNEMVVLTLLDGGIVTWLNFHLIDMSKFVGMGMDFRFYVTLVFVICMNILFVALLVLTAKEYRKELNNK